MIRLPELSPEERRARTEAYIAAFNARSPAEIALDLLEHQDGRWTDADRARRAELIASIHGGG